MIEYEKFRGAMGKKNDMGNKTKRMWFTSDLHLNHENIIKYVDRPFSDVNEMNGVLIEKINEKVSKDDTLWILGDVAMGYDKMSTIERFLADIECRDVHLILGNHDNRNKREELADLGFSSVSDYEEIKYGGGDTGTRKGIVVLSHYPFAYWNRMRDSDFNESTLMLHGHIHSNGEYNEENRRNQHFIYDVGADSNEYSPISIDEIIGFFDAR